jgi:hypothetical protein
MGSQTLDNATATTTHPTTAVSSNTNNTNAANTRPNQDAHNMSTQSAAERTAQHHRYTSGMPPPGFNGTSMHTIVAQPPHPTQHRSHQPPPHHPHHAMQHNMLTVPGSAPVNMQPGSMSLSRPNYVREPVWKYDASTMMSHTVPFPDGSQQPGSHPMQMHLPVDGTGTLTHQTWHAPGMMPSHHIAAMGSVGAPISVPSPPVSSASPPSPAQASQLLGNFSPTRHHSHTIPLQRHHSPMAPSQRRARTTSSGTTRDHHATTMPSSAQLYDMGTNNTSGHGTMTAPLEASSSQSASTEHTATTAPDLGQDHTAPIGMPMSNHAETRTVHEGTTSEMPESSNRRRTTSSHRGRKVKRRDRHTYASRAEQDSHFAQNVSLSELSKPEHSSHHGTPPTNIEAPRALPNSTNADAEGK